MHLPLSLPYVVVVILVPTYIAPTRALPLQLSPRIGTSQISQDAIAIFKLICNSIAGNACNSATTTVQPAILAAAKVCAQQDGADQLVDLAHKLNSTQLVKMARLWMQQPRSSTSSLSMPYCPNPPRNAELQGLYQCQFASVDLQNFATTQSGKPTPVGANTTIPFGLIQPVNPPGSCPDHPEGPIPDQTQLTCLVLQGEAQLGSHGDEDSDSDSDGDDSDDDDDGDNSRRRRYVSARGKGRKGSIRFKDLLKACKNLGH